MSEYFNRLMQMMAEQEKANQNALSEAALRRGQAPGMAETLIDFGGRALRKFDDVLERKRLKQEKEAKLAKETARIAKEKEEKRQQWLLGERFQTQRAYGVPIPELGIEGEKRFAPKSPSMYYDPVTGMLINRDAGTAKAVTEGRPQNGNKELTAKYARLKNEYASRYKWIKDMVGRGSLIDTQTGKPVTGMSMEKYIDSNLTPDEKKALGREKTPMGLNPFNAQQALTGGAVSTTKYSLP
jgi:hypothetical protein